MRNVPEKSPQFRVLMRIPDVNRPKAVLVASPPEPRLETQPPDEVSPLFEQSFAPGLEDTPKAELVPGQKKLPVKDFAWNSGRVGKPTLLLAGGLVVAVSLLVLATVRNMFSNPRSSRPEESNTPAASAAMPRQDTSLVERVLHVPAGDSPSGPALTPPSVPELAVPVTPSQAADAGQNVPSQSDAAPAEVQRLPPIPGELSSERHTGYRPPPLPQHQHVTDQTFGPGVAILERRIDKPATDATHEPARPSLR